MNSVARLGSFPPNWAVSVGPSVGKSGRKLALGGFLCLFIATKINTICLKLGVILCHQPFFEDFLGWKSDTFGNPVGRDGLGVGKGGGG